MHDDDDDDDDEERKKRTHELISLFPASSSLLQSHQLFSLPLVIGGDTKRSKKRRLRKNSTTINDWNHDASRRCINDGDDCLTINTLACKKKGIV